MAAVSEAIEQGRRHLGVSEYGGPFAEAEVRRDDDAGSLVELAQQVEQQGLSRDNQDDEPATIRMTQRRRRGDEGRA